MEATGGRTSVGFGDGPTERSGAWRVWVGPARARAQSVVGNPFDRHADLVQDSKADWDVARRRQAHHRAGEVGRARRGAVLARRGAGHAVIRWSCGHRRHSRRRVSKREHPTGKYT